MDSKKSNGSTKITIIDDKRLAEIKSIKEHTARIRELTKQLEEITSEPPKRSTG